MIIILSKESGEITTDEVIDWLAYNNANFVRFNAIDFEKNKLNCKSDSFIIDGTKLQELEKTSNLIWFRRWDDPNRINHFFDGDPFDNVMYYYHLRNEYGALTYHFFRQIEKNASWVNEPRNVFVFTAKQEQKDYFPKLNLEWDSPFIITNSILDFNNSTEYTLENVIDSLNELGCKALELRFYDDINLSELSDLLNTTLTSKIRTIYIKMQYNSKHKRTHFNKLLDSHSRVKSISVYDSPKMKFVDFENFSYLMYFTKKFSSEECCGNIDIMNFRVNIPMFTESQNFNSCLNRKVSIDKNGMIKSCPSSPEILGDIKIDTLTEVVENNTKLKLNWQITKDQIDDCKICEHRYFCTDCKVYTKDSDNKLSKPKKCNYDPYTNKWKK